MCGLRWEDVNLDAGRISIVRTRVMVNNRVVDSDPKTDAGRRLLPIDASLSSERWAHRKRQLEERLMAGGAWEDTGYVFTDELGAPISPRALSLRFDRLIAKAGVRRIRLHDGRHSAATFLLNDGTPVHIVSKVLGHSKPSITLNVYSHVIESGGDEAIGRLGALLASRAAASGAVTNG